jgi:hypothetical protein
MPDIAGKISKRQRGVFERDQHHHHRSRIFDRDEVKSM